MAGFRGFRSDVTDKVIEPEQHVKLRVTAKGADGRLHEGQIDISWDELDLVLPRLFSGEAMALTVGTKRGRKPAQEAI